MASAIIGIELSSPTVKYFHGMRPMKTQTRTRHFVQLSVEIAPLLFCLAVVQPAGAGSCNTSGPLNTARYRHTATLLSNGKVLVAGGVSTENLVLSSAELYDPASTELYDAGLNFSNAWRPQIIRFSSPLALGGSLVITGSQFRGISGGSDGGTHDSPADVPVVQLRNLENGQTLFLWAANWSTNWFASAPVTGLMAGWTLATVFVNGIQGTSSAVNVSVPVPVITTLTEVKKLTGGSLQFSFTNNVGALFGVLATTNLLLPMTNWTAMSGVAEISPGRFQFNDPQTANSGQRFYSLRSP